MNALSYATALQQALGSVPDTEADRIIGSFLTLVRKHKRSALLPSIVKAFTARIEKEELQKGAVLTVAHEKDRETFTSLVRTNHSNVDVASLQTRVDSTLVGGYVLTQNGTRMDASYKRTLLHMYHNLTTS